MKTKWPVEWGGYPTVEDMRDYERARADAAIERLQLLEASTRKLLEHNECAECAHEVSLVLALISPLPGEQT